ncbi:MAG TPA: AAA family ATPase [Solirubrobacteraceae bacterium]|nr:AAA family ATPase [Solirubrobacteraceae bacterium]
MNDSQLRRLLDERSPWRARADWASNDPDLRAAGHLPLDYEPKPLADIHAPGLYVLRGPRRVGKSLELKRAVVRLIADGADPKTIFYCSCDGLSKQDLRRLVAQGHSVTRTLPGPIHWLLDEVTAVADWSQTIKELRDQVTAFREACVVLTGSSARDLEQARKDLADRRGGIADSDRLLMPMGFRAFCRALGDLDEMPQTVIHPRDILSPGSERAISELEPWSDSLADIWELYLDVGGFPRAVGEHVGMGGVSDGFLQGLWDVLLGDAIRASSMSETEVTALLDRLVANLCSPINASRIARDVGLSGHQSALNRIDDLIRAFLAWRCHRIRKNRPNTAAQRKLYFVDPLIAQLAHRRDARFPAPDTAKLTQQQIGLALARAVSPSVPAAFLQTDRVMYERTDTGAEIDFVGPDLGVPFECKYTDGVWRREALTMKTHHGHGVIITRSPLLTGVDEPVWAVPAGVIAWLLDAE